MRVIRYDLSKFTWGEYSSLIAELNHRMTYRDRLDWIDTGEVWRYDGMLNYDESRVDSVVHGLTRSYYSFIDTSESLMSMFTLYNWWMCYRVLNYGLRITVCIRSDNRVWLEERL